MIRGWQVFHNSNSQLVRLCEGILLEDPLNPDLLENLDRQVACISTSSLITLRFNSKSSLNLFIRSLYASPPRDFINLSSQDGGFFLFSIGSLLE